MLTYEHKCSYNDVVIGTYTLLYVCSYGRKEVKMVKLEFTKIEKLNAEIDDQIIHNLLHPGIAMLYGKEKSYKSMFATSISKCISDVLIQVFIRRSIKRHGSVIYFALDDRGRTISKRFSDLENIYIMDSQDYMKNCNLLKDEMKKQHYEPKHGTAMFTHLLAKLVETHNIEPVLVVVDTWEKIRSAGHQSYYGEEVKELEVIHQLLNENANLKNACVMLVHHSTKDGETYQGSSGVGAEIDIMMRLKSIGEYEKILQIKSNSMPFQEIPISINPETIEFEYSENGKQIIHDEEMRKLLEWCYSDKRPKSQYPIVYEGTYEELMYSAKLNYENSRVFANKLRDNEDLLKQEGIEIERIRTTKARTIKLIKLTDEKIGGNE